MTLPNPSRRLGLALLLSLCPVSAEGRPAGPALLCDVYRASPTCSAGAVDCSVCHVVPPTLNPYGLDLQRALSTPTIDDADYAARLPGALQAVEPLDSDGDGFSNLDELTAGSAPGDPAAVPAEGSCSPATIDGYLLCAYDPSFAFNRVTLDVCGRSATMNELSALTSAADPSTEIVAQLQRCLRSDFWMGVDGQLWQIAFPKVRPRVPFQRAAGAFEPDLNLFVYAQTEDRDARELLTATYAVERDDSTTPPRYFATVPSGPRAPDPQTRAGMLTTTWFNASNTMGQALPRVTAAQAYRAYLGYDIARLEGLFDPLDASGQPLPLIDYDDKGITEPACAQCHRTLDSLAYMFSRYAGAGEARIFPEAQPRPPPPGHFAPNRMAYMVGYDGDDKLLGVPTTGSLFGESGLTLVQWARKAANSEAFAMNLVLDYWLRLVGHPPSGDELVVYERLWRDFMTIYDYRVERMLEALVRTEAYGVP